MNKYILLAAVAIALAACNNEDINIADEAVEAHVTATIGESTVTRATDTSWAVGDAIGISMSDGRYVNMRYIAESVDGKFSGSTMYFKNKREPVTLTAYYPYAGTESAAPGTGGILEASATAANQTADRQPAIDFLFAREENLTGSNPEVRLNFSHKMSKLTLVFHNGAGMDVEKLTSYTVEGLIPDGTFNTASGECAARSAASAGSLTISLSEVKDNEPLPSLIIFPQQLAADESVKLNITDSDGQDYSCYLKFAGRKLSSGDNYLFNIIVNKTGLVVSGSTITDWETKQTDASADSVLS